MITWAMPDPIKPPPITVTFLIADITLDVAKVRLRTVVGSDMFV